MSRRNCLLNQIKSTTIKTNDKKCVTNCNDKLLLDCLLTLPRNELKALGYGIHQSSFTGWA